MRDSDRQAIAIAARTGAMWIASSRQTLAESGEDRRRLWPLPRLPTKYGLETPMDNLNRFPDGPHAARPDATSTGQSGQHDSDDLNLNTDDALRDAFPINEVPRHLPRRSGKRVHISTIWRWIQRGVRGVKLESLNIGGRRYVPREALEHFLEALNRPHLATAEHQPPAYRRREAERAAREVQKILKDNASSKGVA